MLIKDPYLQSHRQEIDIRSQPAINIQNTSMNSQPAYSQAPRMRAFSGGQVNELKGRVSAYEKQIKNLQSAYMRQGQVARKMNNFNQVNREYHQAMKHRNLELNTKLRSFTGQMQFMQNRVQEDHMRHNYDKDVMLKKYEEQADEVLRLRANCNCFIEQKTRLEEEVSNLTFLIEKERHQSELQIKQLAFRMQSMEMTYRGLVGAKDEEIGQLVNRLRNYEDENKKLNDINKTLHLTKDRNDNNLDKISQIHHLESNIKSNKENEDYNVQRSNFKENQELKEQRTVNQELRRELQALKNQVNSLGNRNHQLQTQIQDGSANKQIKEGGFYESSKLQGVMASINSLREGINKEVFDVFFKSVKSGQKKKQNSLVLFIENWKCLEMERLQPYIKSYFEARNNLKEIAGTKQAKESVHYPKIEEVIPLKVGARPGRSNINQWILSTIQFTKNQKDSSKKSLNNVLLFIFRLLTIEYRIKYPMQGKSYNIDDDVTNELMHEIVKGIQMIFKYQ